MDQFSMVTVIKGMQRDDQTAKEQWWAYCDQLGGGVRDPAKHEEAFLEAFIKRFNSGERFEVVSAANWGDIFKDFQRKSKNFKEAWASYCDLYGNGKHDPTKQSQEFLTGFVDFLGRQGGMALAMLGGSGLGGEPASKRARTFGAMGELPLVAPMGPLGMKMLPPSSMATQDPVKDRLVQRIKAFQRSGEMEKQTWWTYCDTMKGTVRDPVKHDIHTLQEFITGHNVP